MSKSILVIDDEEVLRKALERFFREQGYDVSTAGKWDEGEVFLRERPFDLLLVDLMLPQISGIEIVRRVQEIQPQMVCIVMTGFGTISSAIEAIRSGAYHYVTKPFDLEDIGSLVSKALEHKALREENRILRKQLREKYGFESIVGHGLAMKEVFRLAEKLAETDSTVLILGESGTGKELLAHAVHFRSRRASLPFVAVNCGAIPEGLLESELFGHVKGAFTGAVATRPGKFEAADKGTIFLDEIGDMSPALQVKLLRVLQERQVQPVGSNRAREVDVRVIAATHQDLTRAVKENRFREDLFYRLNVIPVTIPPLRNRTEDIPVLIDHFLKKHNQENHKQIGGFTAEAIALLQEHPWPGNVRELENLVERLVVLKGSGWIGKEDLPTTYHRNGGGVRGEVSFPEEGVSFRNLVAQFEQELIRKALEKSEGNKNRAAQLLRLNRTTLIEKMRRLKSGNL